MSLTSPIDRFACRRSKPPRTRWWYFQHCWSGSCPSVLYQGYHYHDNRGKILRVRYRTW